MKLKIADVIMNVSGTLPAGAYEFFKSYVFSDSDVDIQIDYSTEEQIPARIVDKIYGVQNQISEFGKIGSSYILQDRYKDISYAEIIFNENFKNISCKLTDVESCGGSPLSERCCVALGKSVLHAMPVFGGITFHASCIKYREEAVMFAAPSEGGKSTQSALWKKYLSDVQYINDDTPIIKKKNGCYHAFGTPWAGTSGINNNIHAPVKALVYIKQGKENKLYKMDDKESIIRAMRSVRTQFFSPQKERQIKILFDFIRSVPVYELTCDMSREAVMLVKSEIF